MTLLSEYRASKGGPLKGRALVLVLSVFRQGGADEC